MGNPGPLQGRHGNYKGVRANAYNCQPTPPSAPTDRQRQGVFQFGLPAPDETPRYPALCQLERAKGGRGRAIYPNHQDQDINIFVGPRHCTLSECHPGLG